MSYIRDLLTGFLKKPITEYDPNVVVEVRLEDYIHHPIHDREDWLILYGFEKNNLFEIVLQKEIPNKSQQTAYSLCRAKSIDEARQIFDCLKSKLPPLRLNAPSLLNTDTLQEIYNYMKEHPDHKLAHICAHFGYLDCLRNADIIAPLSINELTEKNRLTPLNLAIRSNRLCTVQYLLSLNPDLEIKDKCGNNIFHFAASTIKEIIQALNSACIAQKVSVVDLINAVNLDFNSPLHVACMSDKPECVKELLKIGAHINGASIMDNIQSEGHTSVDQVTIDELETKEMKFGGTPLHWAKSKQCMEVLLEKGCDINARNFQGETVLHVTVSRGKLSMLINLLAYGADVDALGPNGNTALHVAVLNGDVHIVQALVVFGAKTEIENSSGETARHLAATQKKNYILFILHTVGAKRCQRSPSNLSSCNDGCGLDCSFNGNPFDESPFHRTISLCDQLMGTNILKAAVQKKRGKLENKVEDVIEENNVRLLCLDGGGIRGLILVQMLSVLEDMIKMNIGDCFDWIAGTSTGAMLALYLALGHTARESRQLYFKLKDKIFVGSRPYPSEPLEEFLKHHYGEHTELSDIKRPRIMIPATKADQLPAALQVFRNYTAPDEYLRRGIKGKSPLSKSVPTSPKLPSDPANEQLLWKVGRASGAAPSYFRPSGPYLDGGLISNNPTLDALTEITHYNAAIQALGEEKEKEIKLDVVVSLGTGGIPMREISIIDVYRPDSIFNVARIAYNATALGTLLIDQATQSDGQVVERAKAWCHSINVPFFRLNPPISENIMMDEVNDIKLVKMLWETTAYMNTRQKEVEELLLLLLK